MKFNNLELYKATINKINSNQYNKIKDFLNNQKLNDEQINSLYQLLFKQIFFTNQITKINYFEEFNKHSNFKKTCYYNLFELIQTIENNKDFDLLIDSEMIENLITLLNSNQIEIDLFRYYNYLCERDSILKTLISDYQPLMFRNIKIYNLNELSKKDFNYLFEKELTEINYTLLFNFIFSNNIKSESISKDQIVSWLSIFNFRIEYYQSIKLFNYLFDSNSIKEINKIISNLSRNNYINNNVTIDNKELNFESVFYYTDKQKEVFNTSKNILNKSLETMTDKVIVNGFLTFDKELEEQNKKEYELFEELKQLENKINSMLGTSDTSFSNILNTCTDYFNFVRTANDDYLESMKKHYYNSLDTNSLFSPDFCSLIYVVFYTLYSVMDETPLKDIKDTQEYELRQSKLKGLKSLPGYLEINQIKSEPWEAKSDFAKDSKFMKLYSCFYNFYTKQYNPFNELLNDPEFEDLQELAIDARLKLENMHGDAIQKKLEEFFYKPLSDNTHSLYTYVNIIADFFKELNEPVDFELLENFGISLIDFLKNLALETGSSVLLEFVLELFSKDFIKLGKEKYSIMSIYNELYMLKKIFYLINNDEGNLNDIIYQNINDISESLLQESRLGEILKEEGYLALSGFDLTSSVIDMNYLFNTLDTNDSELKKCLYSGKDKDNDDKETIWNLKKQNLSAWITVRFLISKEKSKNNNLIDLDFCNYEYTYRWLQTLTKHERAYCFLSSIKNKYDYLLELNKLLNWNYTEDEIQKIVLLLSNSVNDTSLNLYSEYKLLFEKYPIILDLTKLKDYKNYVYSVTPDIRMFSNVAKYNYDKINQLLMKQQNTPLIDLILRLLPTTRLLFGTFKLPLDKYLDKILSWFDDLLYTIINFLKKLINENKIKFVEQYKRERMYLIKNNWEQRIRAFNILLDVIYLNLGSASLCINHGLLNDKEIIFDLYDQIIDKVKETQFDKLDPVEENKKDPDIVDLIPNIKNPDLDNEESDKIKDKIKDLIDNKVVIVDKKDPNNSKDNPRPPLIIYPETDKSIDEIIKETEKEEIIVIPSEDKFLDWLELEKPGKVTLDYDKGYSNLQDFFTNNNPKFDEVKKDIYLSYINRDLNQLFLNNTSGDYIYQIDKEMNDRYNELTNSKNINFSDSGYHYFVDFKKINSKLLVDVLDKFDLKDYESMKQTSLEVLSSF